MTTTALLNLQRSAKPADAAIPSLSPSLYIYDITTLQADLAAARDNAETELQANQGQDNALMAGFLQSKIAGYGTLMETLSALAEKGETRQVSKTKIDESTPVEYAYDVKTLRDVFNAAHNYAHQRVIDNASSCFVGAYKATLKEVAIDHVAALNSRECGHQYLVTPVQIGSTLVRCHTAWGQPQKTLATLRSEGLARPQVFTI